MEDYKIHLEPYERTKTLVLDWVKNNTLEKVNEVLLDLSWVHRATDEGWYDGQFYGFSQREKESQYLNQSGNAQPDILIHDVGLLPTMFFLSIKTGLDGSDLRFLADLLDTYDEKIPKGTYCSIQKDESSEAEDKILAYKSEHTGDVYYLNKNGKYQPRKIKFQYTLERLKEICDPIPMTEKDIKEDLKKEVTCCPKCSDTNYKYKYNRQFMCTVCGTEWFY